MSTISPTGWRQRSGHDRLDSDRETLPFPAGGVLALKARPSAQPTDQDAPVETGEELLASIEIIQARLDHLQNLLNEDMQGDLDTIAGHIGGAADDWSPSAA